MAAAHAASALPWNDRARQPFAENQNGKNAAEKHCTRRRQEAVAWMWDVMTLVFVKVATGGRCASSATMDACFLDSGLGLLGRRPPWPGRRGGGPVGLRAPTVPDDNARAASPQIEAADVQGSRRFPRPARPRARRFDPPRG